MRSLIVVLVLGLTIAGCSKPMPHAATSGDSQSSHEPDHDPFSRVRSGDSDDTSDATFDELLELIESTIGETERPAPKPFDPPLTVTDINRVLQQCVRHLLTDPALLDTREFYGTPGSTEVVLVIDSPVDWPFNFNPEVEGYEIRFDTLHSEQLDENRILGIRLDKMDLEAPSSGLLDGNITLTVTNVGGTKNGAVIGGCLTFFTIDRDAETYVAWFAGSLDP